MRRLGNFHWTEIIQTLSDRPRELWKYVTALRGCDVCNNDDFLEGLSYKFKYFFTTLVRGSNCKGALSWDEVHISLFVANFKMTIEKVPIEDINKHFTHFLFHVAEGLKAVFFATNDSRYYNIARCIERFLWDNRKSYLLEAIDLIVRYAKEN